MLRLEAGGPLDLGQKGPGGYFAEALDKRIKIHRHE
jgi:hypothetical protein